MKPFRNASIFFIVNIVLILTTGNIQAAVSILKATGGSISADKAANASTPAWTTLGNIRLTEGALTDFSIGTNVTLIVNAPTGWQFNTAAAVTVSHVNGRDISASSVLSKTASAITIQFTVSGTTKSDVLTIAAIQIRANEGANVPGTTNLSRSGTATINGCAAGANLGDLSQTVGAAFRMVTVLPGLTLTDGTTLAGSGVTGTATSQVSGTPFTVTRITVCDQFYNRVTTYSGAKTISYTGPSNGLTAPSFTTSVNFTSGNSTTALTTTLKKAETTTITSTDGTIAGLTTSSLVINPGAAGSFQVEAAAGGNIGTQVAGIAFNIKVSAFDLENNPCNSGPNSYTGTVNITSGGNISAGGGTTSSFVAGVLASHNVTISNSGTFTLTATKTSDTETGTSNSFIVNPGVLNNFLVEAQAGGNIGTQVVDTTFIIKITARDVNNNVCNSGPNNFSGTVDITSTGALFSGGGTTPAFNAGVLASRNITISNAGNFTITATNTSGSESGISNSFDVFSAPILSAITPECVNTGSTGFTITVNGNNFNNTSIVRINGSNRATAFISINQLQATIPASDISSDGTNVIDVINPPPGAGTSNVANLIASSIPSIGSEPAAVTICDDSIVVFTASVTGYQMSFQWMKNGLPISDGGNISGANTSALLINPSSINDTSSSYYLVVSTNCHPDVYSDTVSLKMTGHTSGTSNISICQGQSYTPPGGSAQTTQGTYVTTIPNANGCDSTITTNLTVIANSASTANISICQGQSYTPPGGTAQTTSGTYITTIPNAAGCDSLITSNLTVIPNTASTANISICQGQSYTPPGGSAETTSGTYITTIPNAAGCDSVITTNLTVIPNTSSTANISICQGQSYTPPGGSAETTSGTYITTIPNVAGCDSVITTNLTVLQNTASTANISICQGQNYTPPGGSAQTTSGSYITTIPNAAGCDSVITTNLTVIPNTSSTANITICSGSSYTPPGGTSQTTTGTYVTTISNAAGCDSIITTNLSVVNVVGSTLNIDICLGDPVTKPDNSVDYPVANTTYVDTFPSNSVPGCDSIVTMNVTVNSLPSITATPTQIQCQVTRGSVSLSSSNGTPAYAYSGSDTVNLVAGTYTYIVTDSKGCKDTTTATINSAPSTLAFSATPVQINCYGMRGSVTLNTSGGVTPYTFGGDTTAGLFAGTYNYTVTDANGCSANTSVTINAAPPQLIHTATATQIQCFGGKGSISLSTSGGTPPYTFSGSPTTNLSAGTYNYTVTDSKSCVTTTSALIAPAPAKLVGIITTTMTRCDSNTGTAGVSVNGGSAPFTYLWNTVPAQTTALATGLSIGTYSVLITDGHGCTATASKAVTKATSTAITITGKNVSCPGQLTSLCATNGLAAYSWNNGETTRCLNANAAGTYTVTATNSNGCTSSASKTLTSGTIPSVAVTGNDYLCPGGSVSMCASPGMSSYTWNNGLRAQCRTVNAGGTYSVTVTNATGCTASASHTVKPAMTLGTNVTNGICSNGFLGSINAAVTGQSPPFSYLWNNGATTTGISGLAAGQYIVQVTDNNGCTGTAATNVVVTKTTADYSSINSSFMNYSISAGNYLWFNAAVKVNYTGSYPLTLYFTNQNIKSTKFSINTPNSKLILTNAVSQALTTFNGTEWVTIAPPNISGNYFISGYAYQVPLAITANLNPVTWKGIWTASCPGVGSVEWKWSAAVYTNFTTSLDSVEVKPVDSSTDSQYPNNNFAGAPENFTANLIAGARSAGGTNYTGSYSVTGNRIPCCPSVCNPGSRIGDFSVKDKNQDTEVIRAKPVIEEKTLTHKAYPNPFTSSVTIEMERSENSSNTTIEIYDFKGQKISTLFNDFVDPKVKYTVEFDGESLPGGVYIYKIISGDEMVNGKLILKK